MNLKENTRIIRVVKEYFDPNCVISITPYGKSYLNEKYLITMPETEYILQRINTNIYNSPFGVVHNIDLVSNKIKERLIYEGEKFYQALVAPIPNRFDEIMTIVDDEYWRCTNKIENTTIHYEITDSKMAYSIGALIGEFQKLLDGFNYNILDNNIPHAHNLKYMYTYMLELYKLNPADRTKNCEKEIKFLKTKKNYLTLITNRLEKEIIPYRVTHNGSSISEIVFDINTDEAITYLNMDAVMRGACGYDLGMALRQCTTSFKTSKEEVKAFINYEYFEELLKGYYSKIQSILTDTEKDSLYDSYYSSILEASLLHLEEYLEGNHVSILDYPEQNLDRTRRQIALLKEVDDNKEIISEIFNRVRK